MKQRLALALFVGLCLGILGDSQAEAGRVRLSYYLPTGNKTSSGVYPYPGSAACSINFPMGSIVEIGGGLQITCEDRGDIDREPWIDVFVRSRDEGKWVEKTYGEWSEAERGTYTNATIIRWGR